MFEIPTPGNSVIANNQNTNSSDMVRQELYSIFAHYVCGYIHTAVLSMNSINVTSNPPQPSQCYLTRTEYKLNIRNGKAIGSD
jgi:hypothetical protein